MKEKATSYVNPELNILNPNISPSEGFNPLALAKLGGLTLNYLRVYGFRGVGIRLYKPSEKCEILNLGPSHVPSADDR